jgi:hypothetical protein
MSTTRPLRRLALAFALGVALLVTATLPAGADRSPELVLTGGDRWFTHDAGWFQVVRGPAEVTLGKRTLTGDLTATIYPDDRTMPAPGQCEGGIVFVRVAGDHKHADLFLSSAGEICGHHVQEPTSVVVHSFTGTAHVEEAGRRNLVGKEGFLDIRLAHDGRAHVFASV